MDENHRGKIKKAPAPEVVKYLINPAIKTDLERSYQTILDINKAHVLMLAEEGIISTDVAKKILECTQEISAMEGHPTFEINPLSKTCTSTWRSIFLSKPAPRSGASSIPPDPETTFLQQKQEWTSEVSICVCAACSMSFARIL